VLAIHYLHKNYIVHRDLKLANVLLKSDGHIAIADFGLVKTFRSANDVYTAGTAGLQSHDDPITMSVCGTPCYMAPEMLSGLAYGCEVDWWSFGIMIYTMLEGEVLLFLLAASLYSRRRFSCLGSTTRSSLSSLKYARKLYRTGLDSKWTVMQNALSKE
jgi:serine/threonine protein kinase